MAVRMDTETGIRKYRNRRLTDTGHYTDTGSLREHTERFAPSGTNMTLSVKTTRMGVFWLRCLLVRASDRYGYGRPTGMGMDVWRVQVQAYCKNGNRSSYKRSMETSSWHAPYVHSLRFLNVAALTPSLLVSFHIIQAFNKLAQPYKQLKLHSCVEFLPMHYSTWNCAGNVSVYIRTDLCLPAPEN